MSNRESGDREFRSRDKKVHKMSRDGLVEQNQTTGETQRISQRMADISFEKSSLAKESINRNAGKRESKNTRKKQKNFTTQEKTKSVPLLSSEVKTDEKTPDAVIQPDSRQKQRGTRYHTKFSTSDTPKEAAKPPDDSVPEPNGRLHFEAEQPSDATSDNINTGSEKKPDGTSRQKKRYKKAKKRVRTAEQKLEEAKEKLPKKKHIRLDTEYDANSGARKRRLRFEEDVLPQGYKGSVPKRVGTAALTGTGKVALMKGHQKIRQVEHQNVAVEAAHKAEWAGERMTGRGARLLFRHIKNAPYHRVAKWERRQVKAQMNLDYKQVLRDHPELQHKHFAKWFQKQKIKREYAKAVREAKKTASHTRQAVNKAGQIVRAIAQFVSAHRTVLGTVAALVLIIVLLSSGLSSCTAMLSGVQSSIIATCYVAEEQDINASELLYTELETDLQIDIQDTEQNFPGYDEYRFQIGDISHNPYELMGYLSAAYDIFTYTQVESEIRRLFREQYTLSRREIVEIRTYTDEDGEEHEYEWYVLQTTLTVRPLAGIIGDSLSPGDQTDRYSVYMQTYGNRQVFSNPFSSPWMAYVSSPYGYRVHPISKEKELHRGVDIAVAQGTPILAIQDGKVTAAGSAGGYGQRVIIEDSKGYQSLYAHCASLSVHTGQDVKKGDVIGTVGSTGSSTGPHLHLEVKHNGEYLNPYYFVDTGATGPAGAPGSPGGIDFPDNPGSPMEDKTFEAMLLEAEKYLGYPYVWGGSSPSTSFDCSGFVSWVVNHAGWNVGRQTAQGLYNLSTPVSSANAKPGDLIFFTGTYSSPNPVSHIGIYVGGGRMIHCGDPISYANINSNYWKSHFYAFGRLP